MSRFFPQHTLEWRVQEPAFLRRLSLSIFAMAVLAGIISRLLRWAVMVGSGSNLWLAVGMVLGIFAMLGLATAHLGNFPVRHWVWRAPLFGFLAGVAEAAASAGLIALGVERLGTTLARWQDWVGGVGQLILMRLLLVSIFAAILAAAVQGVRLALLRHEHRDHTARAVQGEEGKR